MTIAAYQVVEVRGRRPGRDDEVGSGFLLSDKLVLTAAHVVFAESGTPHSVVLVQLSQEPDEHFFRAKVAWPARRVWLDAALVEITDQRWRPPQPVQPPRWGHITGGAAEIRCDAIGFPRARRDASIGRDTIHLSGRINPGDQLRGRRYGVSLRSAKPESLQLWKGASGAALFSGALLIGVVITVPAGFDGGMLTAEPSFRLVSDAAFTTILGEHGIAAELESVELEGLFAPPTLSSGNQSRAQMLDAALEVVPFRGREELLAELMSWCETGDDFSARLIIGTGGQGKTRLARELCRRLRREGRVAGLVDDRPPESVIRRLAETSEPVLLVVDLAEGRGDEISVIVDVARRRSPNAPSIRLLMLARSDGDWWDEIRQKTRGQLASASTTVLRPLDDDRAGQLQAYHQALQAFAVRLAEAEPDGHWGEILSRLAWPDADVGTDDGNGASGSALTLQMRALTALLREAGPAETEESLGERPEDALLRYEEGFWSASAPPGRVRSRVLRRAVAAAMLCGAGNATEAQNLLAGLKDLHDASLDDRRAMAAWIHGLYPVQSGRFWGYLQPDRVGEHLIRRVADAEPDFLEAVAHRASDGQLNHAMTVFARIGGRMKELGMLADARKWYRRAAERGHNDAAFKLAELLCEDEPEEASRWYEQAALSGHNDAAFRLGLLLEEGKTAEARKWYERAALSVHNDAAYHLGELLWKEGQPTEARKWFMRAAAAGHTDAAYQLGWLLRREEGDHAGATFWWRMAFEDGYMGAAFNLAGLLAQDGRSADAQHWYRQAAEQGHDDAAYHVGELLWADDNPVDAMPWYEQAAEHGHVQAARQLGWLLNTQGDRAGAVRWWRQAARAGPLDPDTAAKLAEILMEDGAHVEAQDWYKQAASAGHRDAAYQLGELLWADGDPDQATRWYEQAAGQGHAHAAFQLGWLHHAAEEHEQATQWWTRAAELGEWQATPKELGDQLWNQNDPARARQWYEQAARDGDIRAACQLGWLLQAEGDRAGAIYWWNNSARNGGPDTAFQLAELLWQDSRPAEARQWYEQSANDGHADAAYQLGWLLKEQDDHAGAMEWWQTAADRGSENARHHLASINKNS